MKRTTVSRRALVLAPLGRDAMLASAMLEEAGLDAAPCASLRTLVAELDQGAAFVVVTEESLATAHLHRLSAWIDDQEEWSDLPFILLTNRGGGLERNPSAARNLGLLGNVTFLERPFHPTTLVSLARAALRARRRQYDARARMEALRESEARFRFLDTVSQATRAENEPEAIMAATARLLGEHLDADICAYADVEADSDRFSIRRDWTRAGIPSIVGTYTLDSFGTVAAAAQRTGVPLVLRNAIEELGDEQASTFTSIGIAATICLPLVKHGRLAAMMAVHSAKPREWTEADVALVREVTERCWGHIERVGAEAIRRAGEERLRLVIDAATDYAIFTIDADRIITSWSRGAAQIFGYAAEDAIGMCADVLWTPEDRAAYQPEHEANTAGSTGCAIDERWHLRSDGERVFLNGSVRPLPDESPDKGNGFIKIARDETQRRHTEEALREARLATEKLAIERDAILRQLNEGVIVADAAGKIVFVNRSAEGLHGVSRLDIEPASYSDAYHLFTEQGEPYPFEDLPLARAVLRGEHVTDARWRIRRPDGSEILAIGSARPLEVAGEPAGAVLTMRDDTNRHQAEVALRESEERFRNIADHAPLMMWVTDPTGYCTYLNRSWYDYTGQSESEAEGFGWLDTAHPDDKQKAEDEFLSANAEKRPFRIEYRLRRKDGVYRWAIDAAAPRFGADGEYLGYVGSVIDIDDRREIEDRLRLATDASQIGIWDFDPVNGVLRWDERCKALFGLGPDAQIDYDVFLAGLHPDDREQADAAVTTALDPKTAEPFRIEYRTIGIGDGVQRWIAATGGAVFEGEGAAKRAVRFVGTVQDITPQIEAQDRLRESEARFRAMADSAPAPVWVTSADGIAFANKAFGEVAGMPPEEITGEIWTSLIHPDDLPEVFRRREEAWAERKPYAFTARFRRADGELLWMQVSCRPRFDGPALAGFVGIAFDITEMRATEAALRDSEERYRSLYQSIDVGFCVIEMIYDDGGRPFDYRFLEVNPAFPRLLGMPDAVGRTMRDFVADHEQFWFDLYAGVVATGEPVRAESVASGLGGKWFEVFGYRTGAPEDKRVAVLFTDVTVRKQSEARLQEINRDLGERVREAIAERDTIWSVSEDLFAVAGLDGDFRSVNPAWTATLGWSIEEIVGANYGAFLHPDDGEIGAGAFATLLATGRISKFETRYRTKDADYRVLSWTAVVEDDEVYAIARDVTVEKERAAALEAAQEQLRQAQKMETLGQLTGGVAHDFNNLLQIVSGNIGLIQRNLADGDAKLRRAADNAARGAERAAVLTQRLLAFSRRQPLAPKAIDPNKLVGGMSDLLHRTLGETIEIETVLSPRLWPIEVDPHQLENAILNLAINGRDAMADGGKLTIETCNTHLDRAYVAHNAEVASGQYVCISVTDGGSGMDPDTAARAFEPFFTTKDVGKGTGLGLSMVYGFVKQSGGHLKIYSERGEGTTVKIYLPRLLGATPDAGGGDEELVPEGGQDETILVCEDDADVRAYTVEVLRELGYRVLEAEDGPSALSLLERSGQIDLLFTDVVLPNGMTGAVLAREAQARRPGLKVLFTTGYARNAIVHHGRLDPGVELITKPFSYADLAARVRDILNGQK